MAKFPQSLHLIEDFKKSEEYILIKKIESINNSYKIFSGNYADLKDALNEHKERSDDGSMWNDNYLRWEIQDKLVRLMYNFISAAATLVDHTRKHNESLHSPSDLIAIEYRNRIDTDFKSNLLCRFIKDFRNFLSHDKLPFVVSTKRYSRQTTITSFKIRKSSLEGESWNSSAKQFKNSLPDEFDVEELMDNYFSKVEELHEWYKLNLLQHYKDVYVKVHIKKKTLLKLAMEDRIAHALPFNQADLDREEETLKTL